MRILHILDHSLPYFSGYSFRSDSILRAQRRLGLHPVALTSPKHENFSSERETINGIDYHRTHWPLAAARLPLIKQAVCVAALTKKIINLAGQQKIDLIHAHSPSLNGLAASRASRELKLPWIYELRYYDEDAAVSRGKTRHNSLHYRLARRIEHSALRRARFVTTISRALRTDLISRGVDAERIFVVPNGVDADYFHPREPDQRLVAKLGLANKTIIGFIGSFYFYEGLDHLIDAMILLLAKRSDVKLLLVGEGEADWMLRKRIPGQLWDHFVFTGKVAHDEVRRYYSVMDILVYPRLSSRLTELTTPLKPLEAMAMERAVVGSDIGGIRELFNDGETGFLVEPGKPQALAKRLSSLVESETMRRAVGMRAREFVVQERNWEMIVKRYLNIYGEVNRKYVSHTDKKRKAGIGD
jgi:PEP-CTERM/exosortase A-associated glycosyltransferase